MAEEKKEKDCTDCIHYGICYLRRHRENKDDVTPCKDIETLDMETLDIEDKE